MPISLILVIWECANSSLKLPSTQKLFSLTHSQYVSNREQRKSVQMLVAGSRLRFLTFRGCEQEHHSTWWGGGGVWQKERGSGPSSERPIYGSHENNRCAPAVMCTDGPVITHPATGFFTARRACGRYWPSPWPKILKRCVSICAHMRVGYV